MGHYDDYYGRDLDADHAEAIKRNKKLFKQAEKTLDQLESIFSEYSFDDNQQEQLESKTQEIRALLYYLTRDE